MKAYQKLFYIGLIITALGITFSTTLKETLGSLGIVFIAIGCLLFITAMSRKKKEHVSEEDSSIDDID